MLITSINNEHIKELAKLKEKKYRQLTNSFLVEGEHLVLEAYNSGSLKEVIILDGHDYDYKVNNEEKRSKKWVQLVLILAREP